MQRATSQRFLDFRRSFSQERFHEVAIVCQVVPESNSIVLERASEDD